MPFSPSGMRSSGSLFPVHSPEEKSSTEWSDEVQEENSGSGTAMNMKSKLRAKC